MFARATLALALVFAASSAAFAQEASNPNDRHPGPAHMRHAASVGQWSAGTTVFTDAERAVFWRVGAVGDVTTVISKQTAGLEHDPEKVCPALDAGWVPVFGKDHAPGKI